MRKRKKRATDFSYENLEHRRVLASFAFAAPTIEVFDFAVGENLRLLQADATVNGTNQEAFIFDITGGGSWSGDDSDPLIEIESIGGVNNRLEVAIAFFSGGDKRISVDATNDVDVEQFTSLALDGFELNSTTEFAPMLITSSEMVSITADSILVSGDIVAPEVFLKALSGGVDATLGDVVTQTLMLEGAGFFDMTGSGHDVDRFSTVIDGDLTFTQVSSLNIANNSSLRPTQKGLVVRGNADLGSITGDIVQAPDAKAIVLGDMAVSATGGNVAFLGGDADGDGDLDNNFLRVTVTLANDVEIVDSNNLVVAGGAVLGQARFQAGAESNGRLVFDGDLNVGEQLLAQGFNGVSQRVGGITTPEILFGGLEARQERGAHSIRDDADSINNIGQVSAILDNGVIQLNVSEDLEFGASTFESDAGTTLEMPGVDVGRAVRIRADNANVTLSDTVTVGLALEVTTLTSGNILSGPVLDLDADRFFLTSAAGINIGGSTGVDINISRNASFTAAGVIQVGLLGSYEAQFTEFNSPISANIRSADRLVLNGSSAAPTAVLEADISILTAANTTLAISGDLTLRANNGISMAQTENVDIDVCGELFVEVDDWVLIEEPGMVNIETLTVFGNPFQRVFIDGGC